MTEVSSTSSDFDVALLSYSSLSYSASDGIFPAPLPAPNASLLSAHVSPSPTVSHLFLSFLALVQHFQIDFLPITWHSGLLDARRGGTAQLHQMAIDLQSAFAFKRPSPLRGERAQKDLLVLSTEISVLGRAVMRGKKNVVTLEGIAWDVEGKAGQVWPVLVFEKAPWGDLMTFMQRGAGKVLGVGERLSLCADVLVAMGVLHGHRIVHGDVKPQNVLVFNGEEGPAGYMAKMADFGYSSIFVEQARLKMYGTEGWAAPEYMKGMSADFEAARRMDVFSLGLLCLWLLFYNRSETGVDDTTADFLAHRRSRTNLVDIALRNVQASKEMDEETRKNLTSFFEQSLQHNTALRVVDCQTLLGLIAPYRTHDLRVSVVETNNAEIITPTFKIAKSLPQLLLADYRVRQYIAKCLKESVEPADLVHQKDSTNDAHAVELALCYKIGFGTDRDEAALADLTRQARIPGGVVEDTLAEIKRNSDGPQFTNLVYRDMVENGKDFRVDFPAIYLLEGHLEDAIERYSKDVDNLSIIFGPAHLLTLVVSAELCYALRTAGQWDAALSRRTKLTDLMSQVKGEHDRDTLASKSQLAAIYLDLDALDEAEQLLLQVRKVQLTLTTEEGHETLETAQALAEIYRRKGKWQEAQELLLPAIKVRERLLGPEHPDTLRLVSKLASMFLSRQRFDEAQDLLEGLVEGRKGRLGDRHGETLASMSNLATVYYHQGKLKEAEKLYKHVEAVRTELLGEEHKETLVVRANLASLYKKLDKYSEAEQLEELTLKVKLRKFGKDNRSTLTTQGNLALTYAFQKNWEKACSLGHEVVEAKRRVLGPGHPETLRSICNLAEAHMGRRQMETAKTLLLQGHQDALDAGRAGEYEVELLEGQLYNLFIAEQEDSGEH